MNYLILVLFFLCLISPSVASAQVDSATTYNYGIPVTDDDSVQNFPQNDLGVETTWIKVSQRDLPAKVSEALKRESVYRGWQQFPVLYNPKTKIYEVQFILDGDTTSVGLNEEGKPVSYDAGRDIDDQ